MRFTLRRLLSWLAGALLILALLIAVLGVLLVRRSFPQTTGEVQLPGLLNPVQVYRDASGIPHIYASQVHDLFFAMGYTHAQDRFWQMDFWRHLGSGRLAEMFGESQLETDKFLRTLGWARVANQELEIMDSEGREIMQSYAEGVNAYLANHQGSAASLEYAILQLLNPAYHPEPWEPLHSLTWGKVMAWDLGSNMDQEIARAHLLKTLSPEKIAQLFRAYPDDNPVIVTNLEQVSGWQPPEAQLDNTTVEELIQLLQPATRASANLEALTGAYGEGTGSNSWAISGKLSASGKPFLANDPHLGVQMPSIWYEIGLHCQPKSESCPYDLSGFSFAGAPGVIIGHNDRIAWGLTNLPSDVQDLYIERVNPQNPNQYEVNGKWVDMQLVQETIQVAGGEPVSITVRYTRHGPLISDTYGELEALDEQSGLELPAPYAVALRWTALERSDIYRSIWSINRAQNWEEFRLAAMEFDVPPQNLLYADVDGNIGYQMPGKIPIRAAGDGSFPVPGWSDEHEWLDYIPFEQLPYTFNPPEGYLVTANNAVTGVEYPYLLAVDWDYGFRARRIVEMIEAAPGLMDVDYMQKIQGDNYNMNADALLPALMQLPLSEPHMEEARALLQSWDRQNHMDSAQAALFETFWKNLLALTFHDDMPEEHWPSGSSGWFHTMRLLLEQPDSQWWDDGGTEAVETRDQVLEQAFRFAVGELEQTLGKNSIRWNWGDLHSVNFRNPTLGTSGIAPIESLFNRGPFNASGGSSIVNATGWNAASGSYQVRSLPSMRMIVDLGGLNNSLSIHTTGQSGHAYHTHYNDMADLWRAIEYHPMLWTFEQVEAAARSQLSLVP